MMISNIHRIWLFVPLLAVAACAHHSAPAVDVAVIAINDFHGNLQPPASGFPDPPDPARMASVPAGGAEYLAAAIRQLRAGNRNSIVVGAGDLISASPTLSAWFHDEPSIEALSLMGLEASSVGNHEFDKSPAELLRMQNGGCHAPDGCSGPRLFSGAKFHYLSANVVVGATGKTLFAPYYVKSFDGVAVAFIGLTLQETPAIVTRSGTAGLEFRDEAQTVNALIPQLEAQGVHAFVVLIHQGGTTDGGYNDCAHFSGAIAGIVPKLDKSVSVVVSGHTHQAYNCIIDDRLVTSAYHYGMMVTDIDLKLDPQTGKVISAHAQNHLVDDRNYAKDPVQTRLISGYVSLLAGIESRVIGVIAGPLSRTPNAAGESALGDVIADAELSADKNARLAFMNSGGIRTDLAPRANGEVTFGDLFAVQPFGNHLVTITLSGAQIKAVLEQQWGQSTSSILQVSKGFSYVWDAARPVGERVRDVTLNGHAIDPAAGYPVVVSDFLADGADGFSILREAKNRQPVATDIAVMESYVHARSPLAVPPLDRIHRVN
jgi:5'-nucleotidase